MSEEKHPDITVLVASCDKYSDVWEPFSALWRKYWPDCPYEVALATESPCDTRPELCFNRIIPCTREMNWGKFISTALKEIRTSHVILLCDDYFLCDRVDTGRIASLLESAEKNRIGYLPMIQAAEYRPVFEPDPRLALYEKGQAYCIALQAGIWNLEFLKFLVGQYFPSIWAFERKGSFKAAESDFVLAGTRQSAFPFEDCVHKGRWEPVGVRLCERNGIKLDFDRRGRLSEWQQAKKHLKGAILNLNPTLVVKLQNLLHLGKQ